MHGVNAERRPANSNSIYDSVIYFPTSLVKDMAAVEHACTMLAQDTAIS